MADGKTGKTLNLTEGNPLKLILLFAIPVFLGRLFQMMYSLIDTKIVGSILGEEALAAVGSVDDLGDDDDDTGEGNEEIEVDLTKTSAKVQEILFTASIYWSPS